MTNHTSTGRLNPGERRDLLAGLYAARLARARRPLKPHQMVTLDAIARC